MKDGGRHTHDPTPDDPSNVEAEIGRHLGQRRKERGLSLEEVEQATKIRKRYLEGLERGDYAALPEGPYAQGFLKTYANYLGLDGAALIGQLKGGKNPPQEHPVDVVDYGAAPESRLERPVISSRGLQGARRRRIPTSAIVTPVVAVLVLAVVVGTLYVVGRGVEVSRSGDDGANPPPAQSQEDEPRQDRQGAAEAQKAPDEPGQENAPGGATVAGGGRTGEATRQSAPPDALRVQINVQERPSWLLIRTDGIVAYEQVAQPGFSEVFETDRRLYIKAGDAGAVTIEVNGQDAGTLGRTGYIVDKTFTLKSAS